MIDDHVLARLEVMNQTLERLLDVVLELAEQRDVWKLAPHPHDVKHPEPGYARAWIETAGVLGAIIHVAGTAVLRTPFLYIEARGEEQLMLAGSYRHLLVRTPQGLRMQQKRVDLLGAERALPAVQLFI